MTGIAGGRSNQKSKDDGRFGGLNLESLGLPFAEMRKMTGVGFGCKKSETPGGYSKGRAEIMAGGVSVSITGINSSDLIITLVIIRLSPHTRT